MGAYPSTVQPHVHVGWHYSLIMWHTLDEILYSRYPYPSSAQQVFGIANWRITISGSTVNTERRSSKLYFPDLLACFSIYSQIYHTCLACLISNGISISLVPFSRRAQRAYKHTSQTHAAHYNTMVCKITNPSC